MRRLLVLFFVMMLMLSFWFVLPGLTQESKEAKELEGVYTIKKGDTLWDISSRFLKDPFLWPKLWERNPYITNPHWIYPGNPVRLSAVEPAKEQPKEESKKVVEEKPKEGVKPEEKKVEPPPVEKKPAVVAEVKRAPVEEKPLTIPEDRDAGYMSDIEYRGIGIVLESKEGKNIMSAGDIIYLAFRTSEPILIGNKYTIFRVSEEKLHPVTEKRIGRKYNIMGNVKIIDQHGNFFTAKIIESFDFIMRGDYVQSYSKEKMEGAIGK